MMTGGTPISGNHQMKSIHQPVMSWAGDIFTDVCIIVLPGYHQGNVAAHFYHEKPLNHPNSNGLPPSHRMDWIGYTQMFEQSRMTTIHEIKPGSIYLWDGEMFSMGPASSWSIKSANICSYFKPPGENTSQGFSWLSGTWTPERRLVLLFVGGLDTPSNLVKHGKTESFFFYIALYDLMLICSLGSGQLVGANFHSGCLFIRSAID